GGIEVEDRPIEDKTRDRRANHGIAVGVERTATERQIRGRAQADSRGDHMHIARRSHHRITEKRLIGRARGQKQRRQQSKQQAAESCENKRGEARNELLASHAVATWLVSVALARAPRKGACPAT